MDLRADLIVGLQCFRAAAHGQDAGLYNGVMNAMRQDPELARLVRERMIGHKQQVARAWLQAYVDRGMLPADTDIDLFHQVGLAMVGVRLVITGEPVDDAFLEHVVDDVLLPLLLRGATARRASTTSLNLPLRGRLHDHPRAPSTTRSAVDLDPKRWLALGVIAIAQLMIVLDASIVNIALPQAQKDLGISTADRQWVITAYTLAFGGLLLLGGRIADYTGRKRTFIIGLLGFAAASALGGLAQNGGMLFAARALQGAFGALHGAGGPVAHHDDVHRAQGARPRVRCVRCDRRRRRGHRPDPRWGAHRVRLMALVPPASTSRSRCSLPSARDPVGARERRQGDRRYDIPGAILVTAGLVLAGLRVHRGRQADATPRASARHGRLDRPGHRDLPGAGRDPARRVRALGAAHDEPPASPAGRARPQPRRLVPRRSCCWVPGCSGCSCSCRTTSSQPGLQPAQGRLRVPAVQRRHHRRRRVWRPSCSRGSARGR